MRRANDAGFALYEVMLGLAIFAIGVIALGRSVNNCVTASGLSADEARDIGLVSRVFAAREFDHLSKSVLDKLADAEPSAMAATKALFYKLDTLGFLDGISAGIIANADARSTPAFWEGVQRFTSRKKENQ